MNDLVYDFLFEYGFDNDWLTWFETQNEQWFFVDIFVVKNNIQYLEKIGLSRQEILELVRKNDYTLLVSVEDRKFLDEVYRTIKFTDKELRKLALKNAQVFAKDPENMKNLIEEYKAEGNTAEDIKKLFFEDPYNMIC